MATAPGFFAELDSRGRGSPILDQAAVRKLLTLGTSIAFACASLAVHAGAQNYEPLSASVQAALARAVADNGVPELKFANPQDGYRWLLVMSDRLAARVPDYRVRVELLKTV